MPERKVEIHLTPAAINSRVVLDGEEVRNCRGVTVRAVVGDPTIVTLELINVDVTVTGETDVTTIDADVRRYAIAKD